MPPMTALSPRYGATTKDTPAEDRTPHFTGPELARLSELTEEVYAERLEQIRNK
ncbi:hypothetical protein HDU67_003610, partial [Dinochytrium kinnereticum]